ncbi:hypothetical protein [Arthrobacter sp. MA-N2]|uniref:hypothetical protein n=1 Tax=Arthrobacter sp. MA-N2 TaxID=1101188 RepID=UPI00047F110F|nr:hypothetical protein [Arthrobacter sp. MA-N2]
MVAPITEDLMRSIGAQITDTYIDVDGAAGNQCWDSATYINEHFFGLPRINCFGAGRWPGWAGNMVDAFPQSAAVAAAYVLLPPGTPGMAGDTFVWGDENKLWYPSTHVATLIRDNGNNWGQFLSQNSSAGRPWLPGYSQESTGPVIEQTLPFAGCIGIIRPRTSGGINYASTNAAPQEDELSQNEVLQIQGFTNSVIDQVWGTAAGTQRMLQEIAKKIADSTYEMKVFSQASDNFTGDRIIKELRAQMAVMAASVASSLAAKGASAEDIQKAVAEALSGASFNFSVDVPAATEGAK